MSVYIDTERPCLPNANWRRGTVTHLFADAEDELHAFAAKIGLKREWFQHQPGKLPHYDLATTMRTRALLAGAIELTDPATLLRKIRELSGRCPKCGARDYERGHVCKPCGYAGEILITERIAV